MNQKLKDQLPQLTLDNIGLLDKGAVARRFADAIGMVLSNISKYPFRDNNKVETRAIILGVYITPRLKFRKVGVESGHGQQTETKVPELAGVTVRAKIKSDLPDAETADVRMACDIVGGKITDVRFNPENNDEPEQLEMFDDEDDTPDGQ